MDKKLLLLALGGGAAVFFISRGSSAKPAISTKTPDIKPLPADKYDPNKKDDEFKYIPPNNGFMYNCDTFTITDKNKLLTFFKNSSKSIATKFGINNKKTFVNVNIPLFSQEVIAAVNPTCVKNPELLSGEQKVIQISLVAVYLSLIFKSISDKENISETEKDQIVAHLNNQIANYYKPTAEDVGKYIAFFSTLLPDDMIYSFDCNSFDIKNESAFDVVVALKFMKVFFEQGASGENLEEILNVDLAIAFVKFLKEFNPLCTIENISEDVFKGIFAIFIATYRSYVSFEFNDVAAQEEAEENIIKLYQYFEVSPEEIEVIEKIAEDLGVEANFPATEEI